MAYIACAYRTFLARYVVELVLIKVEEKCPLRLINGGRKLCRCPVHLGVQPRIDLGCFF